MSNWNFFWCNIASDDFSVAGEPFNVEKAGISKFKATRQYVEVVDPIYGKLSPWYEVYLLEHDGLTLRVAYREHTPGVYVAFADDETLPFCTPRFRWDPEQKWVRTD